MKKEEVQQRVLKDGKPLDINLFDWDEKTKTFTTAEGNLVIGFSGLIDCTFDTGSHCTFETENNCTFDTGSHCTFNTWDNCTFDTGHDCTFDTRSHCTFETENNCTFNTWHDCTFKTEGNCVIVNRNVLDGIQPSSVNKNVIVEFFK